MIEIIGVPGLPEVRPGDDLVELTLVALRQAKVELAARDVLVFTSKVVSKVEGRLVALEDVTPSPFALAWAEQHGKEPRQVEVVLREAKRIVRMDRGILLAETRHGFICANAGVDRSNSSDAGTLVLLPLDPDGSARRLRAGLAERTGQDVAVVISDTFGRPWRNGQTNIAIGCAGMPALHSYHGELDPNGQVLHATSIALADELAAASELVMGKLDRVPVAVIRGFAWPPLPADAPDEGAQALVRQAEFDLFR
jgi:coenzyme F420-0:L-glutamate ligase/coenzyme F420-1:gamma-L-glutamate ligase